MTSYIRGQDVAKCYGCRACEQICPKQAIEMKANPEGFLYPVLTREKCIKCGLCFKVCPYDTPSSMNTPVQAVAAQYKNGEALLASSSGGLFSAAADYVLAHDGYVAGCIFDDSLVATHILTNRRELVEKMRGSKYVQSDLQSVYTQIRDRLKEGALVLFTGTPCQVDGLCCFLRKDYANLFTIDLICHGVPSPKLLSDYLAVVKAEKGIVSDLKFRDKNRNGWGSRGTIVINNKQKNISPYNNSYYQLYYLRNSVSRMSCYSCKYSTDSRVGDLTFGDYWNMPDEFPDLDVSAGFSAVLVNTEKGKKFFAEISDGLNVYETSLESVVRGNGNLSNPSSLPESRKNIYLRIAEEGYSSVAKKDCKYQYVKPFVRKHIPKGLKKLLKKILR